MGWGHSWRYRTDILGIWLYVLIIINQIFECCLDEWLPKILYHKRNRSYAGLPDLQMMICLCECLQQKKPAVPCTTFCRAVEIRHLAALQGWFGSVPFLIVQAVTLCMQLAAVASVVVSILAMCRFIVKRWWHEDSLRLLSCFFIMSLFPDPWYCQIALGCCTKQGFLRAQSWRETMVLQSSWEGEYACMCATACFFPHGRKKERIPYTFLWLWDHLTWNCGLCCLSHSPMQLRDHTLGPAVLVFTPTLPFSCRFWAKPTTQVSQLKKSASVERWQEVCPFTYSCCLWTLTGASLLMGRAVLRHTYKSPWNAKDWP